MKDKKSVAMIGAGSWGTALSLVLGDNGHTIHIWGKDEKNIAEINNLHQNSKYLPGITLPNEVKGTTSLEESVHD
ncbi:NAD(P)H-dependent glycerol-3-phosphate dehydrogenase, partial [Streptococcus hyovaginalis]